MYITLGYRQQLFKSRQMFAEPSRNQDRNQIELRIIRILKLLVAWKLEFNTY